MIEFLDKSLDCEIQFGRKKISLIKPNPNDIDLDYSIQALCRIPHWNGLTTKYPKEQLQELSKELTGSPISKQLIPLPSFSVAKHSLVLSNVVSPELSFTALMHDYVEAFIGDISRPLKNIIRNESTILEEIEHKWNMAMSSMLDYIYPFPEEIIALDTHVLGFERILLMPECEEGHRWHFKRSKYINDLDPQKLDRLNSQIKREIFRLLWMNEESVFVEFYKQMTLAWSVQKRAE